MPALPYKIDYVAPESTVVIKWSAPGVGWGEVTFRLIDGKVICDSERMSREFVKTVLNHLVDSSTFEWEQEGAE